MTNPPLHIHAVELPYGRRVRDLWVTSEGFITSTPQEGAKTLEGRFVAPGMVDAHVHLSIDFAGLGLPHGDPQLVTRNAALHVEMGVLAVRDAGYVQQLPLDGVILPQRPVIARSGWISVPTGRFFPGVDIGKLTDPGQLVARVHETADAGIKWFKVIADFPGADMNLFTAPLNYSIEELRDAARAAHARGMMFMAHSTGPHVGDIVEAGADAIEHGTGITPEVVRLMADRGSNWTPTLATVEAFLRKFEDAGAPTSIRQEWDDRMSECLPLAVSLGVPVMVGSDELAHGCSDGEMEAMVRHGLTTSQVLACATVTARRVLGLPGIEEGAVADLVIWKEDPRLDLNVLRRPLAVVAEGKIVGGSVTGRTLPTLSAWKDARPA
jgi:imidazolonepropionase-like amidohydrolase